MEKGSEREMTEEERERKLPCFSHHFLGTETHKLCQSKFCRVKTTTEMSLHNMTDYKKKKRCKDTNHY